MVNAPAYQTGASRLVWLPSSRTRASHHARWSCQGLAVVEGLRGDLPGVVDPHEPGRMAAGRRIVHGLGGRPGRIVPGRHIGGRDGPEGPVEFPDQDIGKAAGAGGFTHDRGVARVAIS